MSRVIVGMTVSLDGYVEDGAGGVGRLYPDLADLGGYLADSVARTGAVLMGRRTWEMGDPDSYVGNYEYQVPLFVLTHQPPAVPPKQDDRLTVTFVTDGLAAGLAAARAAAGPERDVTVVGGIDVVRQLLTAGLADELHVDVVPVLLGAGRRLLDSADLAGIQLTKVAVVDAPGRTGLRYRIAGGDGRDSGASPA